MAWKNRDISRLIGAYALSDEGAFCGYVIGQGTWSGEFDLPASLVAGSTEYLHASILEDWNEIASNLPDETRSMAESFVSLCINLGAFDCEPRCYVDTVEDGHVMFDWNNGELPLFTVVITPKPSVVYVGKFNEGKVSGEDHDVHAVRAPIERFLRQLREKTCPIAAIYVAKYLQEEHSEKGKAQRGIEAIIGGWLKDVGRESCPIVATQDSSFREVSAVEAGELPYTPRQATASFRSLQLTEQPANISAAPVFTSPAS